MKKKRLLVACEYSGTVRDAFIAKGWDAVSCDLLPTDKPGPHYQGDVMDIINDGWDMMIAHPPCTYISRAGARWMHAGGAINQDRLAKALAAKEFFLSLLNAKIPKVCVENPTPLKILELPPASCAVQPWEHGHPYSKRTLLWLRNLPLIFPSCIVAKYEPYLPSNTGGKKRGQSAKPKHITWKDSAQTFNGIAQAMADQWGAL